MSDQIFNYKTFHFTTSLFFVKHDTRNVICEGTSRTSIPIQHGVTIKCIALSLLKYYHFQSYSHLLWLKWTNRGGVENISLSHVEEETRNMMTWMLSCRFTSSVGSNAVDKWKRKERKEELWEIDRKPILERKKTGKINEFYANFNDWTR